MGWWWDDDAAQFVRMPGRRARLRPPVLSVWSVRWPWVRVEAVLRALRRRG